MEYHRFGSPAARQYNTQPSCHSLGHHTRERRVSVNQPPWHSINLSFRCVSHHFLRPSFILAACDVFVHIRPIKQLRSKPTYSIWRRKSQSSLSHSKHKQYSNNTSRRYRLSSLTSVAFYQSLVKPWLNDKSQTRVNISYMKL